MFDYTSGPDIKQYGFIWSNYIIVWATICTITLTIKVFLYRLRSGNLKLNREIVPIKKVKISNTFKSPYRQTYKSDENWDN